jgi:hypothetical protein
MIFTNRSFYVLLFLSTFFGGCKNKTTQFFLDYKQEVTLPAAVKNWVLDLEAIQTDCQIRFEKNDTKRSKVDKVYLKKVTLLSDEQHVFKTVQLMTIKMASPAISRKKIAFKSVNTILSDSSVQYQLMESVENVKEFIKHKQFSIELNFSGEKRKMPVKATLILEFLVEGELIKTILHQRMLV